MSHRISSSLSSPAVGSTTLRGSEDESTLNILRVVCLLRQPSTGGLQRGMRAPRHSGVSLTPNNTDETVQTVRGLLPHYRLTSRDQIDLKRIARTQKPDAVSPTVLTFTFGELLTRNYRIPGHDRHILYSKARFAVRLCQFALVRRICSSSTQIDGLHQSANNACETCRR